MDLDKFLLNIRPPLFAAYGLEIILLVSQGNMKFAFLWKKELLLVWVTERCGTSTQVSLTPQTAL